MTHSSTRRPAALVFAAISAAGFATALAGAYRGMRALMIESNANGSPGFCARGGPYEIASECSDGTFYLLFGAIAGAVLFGGLLLGFLAWSGGPRIGAFTLVGVAFAVLGWNFVELGLKPPGEEGIVAGWIVSGICFWLMAVFFLCPGLLRAAGWARRRGAPEPPALDADLVSALMKPPPATTGARDTPEDGTSAPVRLAPPKTDQ